MLRRFFIISLSLLTATTLAIPAHAQTCQDNRRVVRGVDTDIKDHPWQVALAPDGQEFKCGGALIQDKWVLTAAHCFPSGKADRAAVKAGITKRSSGVWSEIDRVFVHEGYNSETQENDIALVRLKFAPAGGIIPLAQPTQEIKPCELLEVTGWGRTSEGEDKPASETLQKGEVPYIENATCNAKDAYDGAIKPGMMCAGFREGGVDSCQGDSGGPLVLRGPDGPVLVGVVSWGEGCARKLRYGIYTRVTAHSDWIVKTILANQN